MNPSDNTNVRVRLDGTDDSGKQQKVRTKGRKRENLGGEKRGVVKLQQYGFSYNAPAGSLGRATMLGGNPDQTFVDNLEHPDHRPKGLAEGQWKNYDMWGHFLHAREDGWEFKIGSATIMIGNNGVITITGVTINLVGNIHLGSTGGVPAAMQGSIDTDGDAEVENLATRVWVT